LIVNIRNETLEPKFTPNSRNKIKLTYLEAKEWLDFSDSIFPPTAPLINFSNHEKPIFFAIFDGTYNDRENSTLTQTVPARLSLLLDDYAKNNHHIHVKYYNGVGTRVNWIKKLYEGITGEGTLQRAELAYNDYIRFSNSKAEAPNVYAIGFSRGAATARHFLNLVDTRLAKHNDEIKDDLINSTRSFALLFDTVATGQSNNLNLNVSNNTISVLHIIAKNENRVSFPVTSVHSEPTPLDKYARVIEYSLPGVHSDIGGGYNKGLETLVLKKALDWLFVQGIKLEYENIDHRAHTNMGMNDSGWLLTPLANFFKGLLYDEDSRSILYLEQKQNFKEEKSDFNNIKKEIKEMKDETNLYIEYSLRTAKAVNQLRNYNWLQRYNSSIMSLIVQINDGHLNIQTNCIKNVHFDPGTATILINSKPYMTLTPDLISEIEKPEGGFLWLIEAEEMANFK
jgi:hypothetical protein